MTNNKIVDIQKYPQTKGDINTRNSRNISSKVIFFWAKVIPLLPFSSMRMLYNRIYSLIFIAMLICSMFVLIKSMPVVQEISLILTYVTANFSVMVLIFSSHFFSGSDDSIKLAKSIKFFETECKTAVPFPYEQIIFHILFILYSFFDFQILSVKFQLPEFVYVTILSRYLLLFSILFSGHIVLIFKNRFKQFNIFLKSISLRLFPDQKQVIKDILDLRQSYQRTVEEFEYVGNIFGYFFILSHLFLLLQVVNDIHTIITKAVSSQHAVYFILACIMPPLMTFVSILKHNLIPLGDYELPHAT